MTKSKSVLKNRFAMSLLLLLIGSPPTRADILAQSDSGFLMENVIEVPVTPERAWTALVEEVGQWWPADHSWFGDAGNFSIQATAGGCFCEIDGQRQVEHMRISHVNPAQRLRMLGGLGPLQGMGWHGALDWIFEPTPQGSRIRLRYQAQGFSPEPMADFISVVDRVQAEQLGHLGRHLGRHLEP